MEDAERAARRVPGWERLALAIEPITTGLTNRNFRVTLPDGTTWVIRLPGERTEVLGIDRAGEAAAAARADELGVGPPVLGALPGVGTLVTRFVAGHHLEPDAFASRFDAVIPLIRRFHDSGPITGRFPVFRIVEAHARDAAALGVPVPRVYEALRSDIARIEHALAAALVPDAPCHNDLLPANVLFGDDGDGERAWLLDWEYAGMNDPWFDLGNLAANAALDDDGERRLVELYAGVATAAHVARLRLMKIVSELREGMWAVVQQGISTLTHVDFVAYAGEHLERCASMAADRRVERWLADAAAG